MRRRRRKKERSLIARFKCRNEARGNQVEREKEEKMQGICGTKTKSLEHIVKECEETRSKIIIEEFSKKR